MRTSEPWSPNLFCSRKVAFAKIFKPSKRTETLPLEDVLAAVLEVDGTISVVPRGEPQTKRLRQVRSSRNR